MRVDPQVRPADPARGSNLRKQFYIIFVPRSDIWPVAVVGMDGWGAYGFGGVLLLEYDTKGVLLSVDTREAFG